VPSSTVQAQAQGQPAPANPGNDPTELSRLMAEAQDQYQVLLKERGVLNNNDQNAVQAFNAKAAAYKALNDRIEQIRRGL